MSHTAPLLHLEGICKSFGSAQVLREVNLRLDAGEVLALLGANGAGKSTLVKILCGVYSRDAGTVRLDDQAVRYDRPEEAIAHGVRFLPQEVSVLPDLTVAENILIADLPLKRSWLGKQVDLPALRQWTQQGLAVLLISSDAEEVAGVCDRSIVLDRGRVSSHFSGGAAPADLLHTPTAKDHP